jgi:hypothetical protein
MYLLKEGLIVKGLEAFLTFKTVNLLGLAFSI